MRRARPPGRPDYGAPPGFADGHLSNGLVHYLGSLPVAEKARVIAHELAHLGFPGDEEGASVEAILPTTLSLPKP